MGADEHALGRVLALERRAERVQLREHAALVERHEQRDALEAAGEVLADRLLDVEHPLARARRDEHGVGIAVAAAGAARRSLQRVDLVEHEQARHLGGADLVEHALDRGDLALALLLVGRGVGDVQHEVGEQRLLERRGERGDELVRQLAHEADRVGQEVGAPEVVVGARRRDRASRRGDRPTRPPSR